MASTSTKGSLPYGWIVKTSKQYPDRVYYFNLASGASTWECPELDPPRLLENKEFDGKHTSILNRSSEEPEEAECLVECQVSTAKTLLEASEKLKKTMESRNPAKKSLLSIRTLETNLINSTDSSRKPLLPTSSKLPLHSVPMTINGMHPRPLKKTLLLSPEQSEALPCSVPARRKRKLKEDEPVSTTVETTKALINPPTAIVAPVVLEKNASTSSSYLPPNRKNVKVIYYNKRTQLKKQTLPAFTQSTTSNKEAKQSVQAKSSKNLFSNKSSLTVSESRLGRVVKRVTVPSSQTASTSASSSESYDTDLDMISEMEEPTSVSSAEYTTGSSMLSEIQNNSCEDVEMLDVSADLTKIDDLTVSSQVTDSHCSYYIVIDTNVLIEDLNCIDEMKDTPLNGCGPPHIFIPWIVIQELDALKRSTKTSGTGKAAQQAVRYLNKVLKSKHPRFHGQSPQEAADCAKSYSKCNDDKILECCMSLAQKMPPEKVVLITYDKNLINKALICSIIVHSWDSLKKEAKPDVLVKGLLNSKKKRRKNKKASPESLGTIPKTSQRNPDQNLIKQQDVCKAEIHTIMSEARQLLKVVLESFLTEEMNEAYGDPWNAFPINKQLLKGILDAISKYWRSVFAFHFAEKDKRNFELLREKVCRPEGFLGDREDCLSTLTAIEDIFCRIKRRWSQLEIPIEQVEDLRLKCNDTFMKHNSINVSVSISQPHSAINLSETESVLLAFENAWTVINHLCGMVMDFYQIQHNFVYEKPDSIPSEVEFRNLMINLYPCVQNIKQLMLGVVGAIKNHNPRSQVFQDLYKALNELVPTLQIQANNPSVPNFNAKALEIFCRDPENTERVQLGCKQIEHFFSKLDQAVKAMASFKLDKSSNSMALD